MIEGIKSVLVAVTEEGEVEETVAVSYGLSLARQANAHLTVQAAANRFSVPYSMLDDFSGAIVATENKRIAALAEKLASDAKFAADLAGVVSTVESPQLVYNSLLQRFLAYARVNDLSILDAETATLNVDRGLIETALFDSGRPVLVVPPGHASFSGARIVIAWDGGASAARAVADALPLLRAAEAVEIVSVTGEKDLADAVPGVELGPHLSRHGVDVSVKTVPLGKGRDVAQALQDEAQEFGADLLVSGGYRHSRLREWLLGGVTQSLLKNGKVPLFMCH